MLVPTDLDSWSFDFFVRQKPPGQGPSQAAIDGQARAAASAEALAAGVKIAAGSDNYLDFGIPQGEAARHVLFAYGEAGLTPAQVLRAATRRPATPPSCSATPPSSGSRALADVRLVIAAGRVHRTPEAPPAAR